NFYYLIYKKNKSKYLFENNKIAQLTHHVLFPTLLYSAFIFFGFINNRLSLVLIISFIFFVVFLILMQNIYSYYKNEFTLNQSTSYIYDFISIVTLFLHVQVILKFVGRDLINKKEGIALFTILMILLILLMNLRHKMSKSLTAKIGRAHV